MNEEIDIILSRYFSGEATSKELHTLDIWLSESDENEHYFHQMTKLYQYAGQTDVLPAIDTEKALAQFKTYIHNKQKKSYPLFFITSKIWRVAAAITILLVSVFTLFYISKPEKTVQVMAKDTQIEYTIFENADVTLFAGTEIVYNKKSSHQIQLKGKATFNIQSEDSKKIIVQAGETYIEDIGTVFTVDAVDPAKSITVEVTEGEVWFYTESNTGIYLKAGEHAMYDAQTKQFNIIEEPAVSIEELLENELVFYNTPLCKAIEIIKARYNVDILINSKALNEILLNASFDNNESVEYILEIIAATFAGEVVKKSGSYVITL